METLRIVLLLLAASVPLALLARWLALPYAVTLVLGGMALAFLPFLPDLTIEPGLVLAFFLPPLLHGAAVSMPWRAFRANLRPILLLAVGLVLFTTLLVGVAAKLLIPSLPWAVCFAVGAIISPPDAVAASSVLERMRLPPRLVVVLEGESLVNDASGLILYKFAIAAALTGGFSFADALVEFAAVSVLGVGVGCAVGLATMWMARRLPDTMLVIAVGILAAYGSYQLAEELGGSGVLGTVACGLIIGWRAPMDLTPEARIAGKTAWEVIVFLMNTVLFLFVGMSLDEVVIRVGATTFWELVSAGLAISLVAIAVRFLWVFPASFTQRYTLLGRRRPNPPPPVWSLIVVSWAGMRGVVSLAAALAIPTTLPNGAPFPGRDAVQVITFVVILVTLVGQATTLGPLIRALGAELPSPPEDPNAATRVRIAEVAVEHLRQRTDDPLDGAMALDLLPEFEARAAAVRGNGGAAEAATAARLSFYLETKRAQHSALLELHRDGRISDATLQHLQLELDLDELRMRRVLGSGGER